MFSSVVGHSEEPDADAAVEEIVQQCKCRLNGTVPSAGLLFAAIDFDHQGLLCGITRAFPEMELIGCTTDGELSSELGFREDSATLILFASDTVDIKAGVGRGLSGDVAGACRSCDAGASPLRTFSPLEFPLDLRSRIADPFDGGSDFGRGRAGFLGLVARLVPLSAGYLGAVLRAAAFRSR